MTELPDILWDEGGGNEIFEDLANAFLRLLENAPVKSARLVELVEEGKRVKVTQITIAEEAGQHRQRLQDYPRLRELIRTFKPTHGTVENTTNKLAKRAAKIEELETLLKLALSRQAEAIALADDLRGEIAAKEAAIARLQARKQVKAP
jgi:DNA repair exonuclease SbcCD ATPase subunit